MSSSPDYEEHEQMKIAKIMRLLADRMTATRKADGSIDRAKFGRRLGIEGQMVTGYASGKRPGRKAVRGLERILGKKEHEILAADPEDLAASFSAEPGSRVVRLAEEAVRRGHDPALVERHLRDNARLSGWESLSDEQVLDEVFGPKRPSKIQRRPVDQSELDAPLPARRTR